VKASLYTKHREDQRQVTNFTRILLCILALHLAAYSGYIKIQNNICFVRNATNYCNLLQISSLLCLIICSNLFNHEGRPVYVFIPKRILIFAFNIFVLMFGFNFAIYIIYENKNTLGEDRARVSCFTGAPTSTSLICFGL
jgi:hypothetical protein